MKSMKRTTAFLAVAVLSGALPAQAALKVVATTGEYGSLSPPSWAAAASPSPPSPSPPKILILSMRAPVRSSR